MKWIISACSVHKTICKLGKGNTVAANFETEGMQFRVSEVHLLFGHDCKLEYLLIQAMK